MIKRTVIRFLQKLGLYPMPDDYPLPTIPLYPSRKAYLNSMTVEINGVDFDEYAKDVEIAYADPRYWPGAGKRELHPLASGDLLEEQRKWEAGQFDTQPIPVINPDTWRPDFAPEWYRREWEELFADTEEDCE